MNEARKQLFEMLEVVNVYNQTVLAKDVECHLVDLGDPTREH
jgi:hypothetical protein